MITFNNALLFMLVIVATPLCAEPEQAYNNYKALIIHQTARASRNNNNCFKGIFCKFLKICDELASTAEQRNIALRSPEWSQLSRGNRERPW